MKKILHIIYVCGLFMSCDDNAKYTFSDTKCYDSNKNLMNQQHLEKNSYMSNISHNDIRKGYTKILSFNGYEESECRGTNEYISIEYHLFSMKHYKIVFNNSKYGVPIITKFAWPIEMINNQYSIHTGDGKCCYNIRESIRDELTKEQMESIGYNCNISLGILKINCGKEVQLLGGKDYKKWIKKHPETKILDY
jgi:hypothetical protein